MKANAYTRYGVEHIDNVIYIRKLADGVEIVSQLSNNPKRTYTYSKYELQDIQIFF